MSSGVARRERVAVAMLDVLRGALPANAVERNRRADVDPSEAPFFVMRDLGHSASYENVGLVNYTMRVEVEGTVAESGDLSTASSAYYVTIISSLMADFSL